jgi:hypothetical protein
LDLYEKLHLIPCVSPHMLKNARIPQTEHTFFLLTRFLEQEKHVLCVFPL